MFIYPNYCILYRTYTENHRFRLIHASIPPEMFSHALPMGFRDGPQLGPSGTSTCSRICSSMGSSENSLSWSHDLPHVWSSFIPLASPRTTHHHPEHEILLGWSTQAWIHYIYMYIYDYTWLYMILQVRSSAISSWLRILTTTGVSIGGLSGNPWYPMVAGGTTSGGTSHSVTIFPGHQTWQWEIP